MAKKDIYKFTIQFSGGDPQHQQVAEILNQQGRRKAQFLVNTVLHYIHCSETPDIPQPSPVNTDAIEAIVRRIMEEYSEKPTPKDVGQAPEKKTVKSEEIAFDDAAELLGEDGMAAIKNTMASFRRWGRQEQNSCRPFILWVKTVYAAHKHNAKLLVQILVKNSVYN